MKEDPNIQSENEQVVDMIEGKNSITEALKAGRPIEKLWVAVPENGRFDPMTYKIMKDAKEKGAVVIETNRKTLDRLSSTHGHQGIIARVAMKEYSNIDEIIAFANSRNEKPIIIILTGLKDPYNMGSVLRIADAAGVHGVIVPKHRSVGLDSAVAKTSAGAIEYVRVARVTNISDFITQIKEKGFWVYGASQKAEKLYSETDYSGAAAIVIGGEGEGISDNIYNKCDFHIKIPMNGNVNSLNAAVATGIIVFEAVKTRFVEK